MIDRTRTVEELSSRPELAILDVLERTLQLASCALLAAYKDPGDVSPTAEEEIKEAYTLAIVNQLTALELTLVRYRRTVEQL